MAVACATAVTAPPAHTVFTSEAWRLHVRVFGLSAIGVSNCVFRLACIYFGKVFFCYVGYFFFHLVSPSLSSSHESLSVPFLSAWSSALFSNLPPVPDWVSNKRYSYLLNS